MTELTLLYTLCVAYTIGSVPSAIIVSRLFGLPDPRRYGSNNPGATNVLRSGHKKAALFTLVLDILKGALAVWAVQLFGGIAAVAMLGAVLGHVYPVWLRFKGGKGVATAIGAIAMYAPWLALTVFGVFGLILVVSRYVSLSSSIAAAVAPLLLWLGRPFLPLPENSMLDLICMTVLSLIIVLRHRQNLYRLYQGTENRFGKKDKQTKD